MLKKILSVVILFPSFFIALAQSDSSKAPALNISGSLDLYYRYDFAKTKSNNATSFTNSHNSFELGMATVKLQHKTDKFDVVADLGFGKRAQEFSYNDNGILAGIKQMYVSYSPASWVKLTAGSWATHVGYELVDANLNRNYSMSYMFTNGPFTHTGIRADLTKGKNGFMIGISNPTDFKYVPSGVMNKKFVIAQYSYNASDIFKLYLNYVDGQGIDTSKTQQYDAVITSKLSDKFSLGFNGTLRNAQIYQGADQSGKLEFASTKSWWGSALYLNFDPSSKLGLTLRGEYFDDEKLTSGSAIGGNVFATTLSANLKTGSFIFIPEIRFDNASSERFLKANSSVTKSAASILFAAVYQF